MKSILEILKEDQHTLQRTMHDLKHLNGSPSERYDECFSQFKTQFKNYDGAEEDVFYPELKKHPALEKLVCKGIEAHHLTKIGIMELRLIPFENERWLAKFSVIRDLIANHLEEEEEWLFPKVEILFSPEILEAMGNKALDLRSH